jgi:hypothetical protein
MGTGARGAWAILPEVAEPVLTMMAILPVDVNAFGFGDGDMLWIR